jgi:hypothetical protein
MGKAYGADLAWRVVWYILFWRSHWDAELPWWLAREVADSPLAVSPQYVIMVWWRYWQTGDVATHQGYRHAEPANKKMTFEEDSRLIDMLLTNPRWQLKDHVAALCAETRKVLSYSLVCAAVWRLGFSRQVLRNLAIKGDRVRADSWLVDLLGDYELDDLLVLDETSKDLNVLKGSIGYAVRGQGAVCHDLPALAHRSRTSMLNVFSPIHGFLDHAFVRGTYNTEQFVEATTQPFVDWQGRRRRPILVDYLRPGMCVLLDNARIHNNNDRRFIGRLAALGAEVRFLPPYCWWLSPLDNGAYGLLVQWMRANPKLVASMPMEAACEMGMRACMCGEFARNMFWHCGYTRGY